MAPSIRHNQAPVPVTVPAREVLSLWEQAAAFASTDGGLLPVLTTVQVSYDGTGTLTALATDRYIACRAVHTLDPAPDQPSDPWTLLLRRADIALACKAYRVGRTRVTHERLTLTPAGLDTDQAVLHIAPAPTGPDLRLCPAARDGQVALTITCPRPEWPFPASLADMFAASDQASGAAQSTSRVSLQPELLARVVRVVPRRQPMRFTLAGPGSPVRVDLGPGVTALLMVFRDRGDAATSTPTSAGTAGGRVVAA